LIYKHQKKNKCIGVFSDSSNLILGEDLSMEEVVEMADKYVVGKVYGHHFSEKTSNLGWLLLGGHPRIPSPQIQTPLSGVVPDNFCIGRAGFSGSHRMLDHRILPNSSKTLGSYF
jgi:hypothetical protein